MKILSIKNITMILFMTLATHMAIAGNITLINNSNHYLFLHMHLANKPKNFTFSQDVNAYKTVNFTVTQKQIGDNQTFDLYDGYVKFFDTQCDGLDVNKNYDVTFYSGFFAPKSLYCKAKVVN